MTSRIERNHIHTGFHGVVKKEAVLSSLQQRLVKGSFSTSCASPSPAPHLHSLSEKIRSINEELASTSSSSMKTASTMRSSKNSDAMPSASYLPRNEWTSLGEGWHQITAVGSGLVNRYGLHSVLEANNRNFFSCLYVPRAEAAHEACVGPIPAFDLELQTKLISNKESQDYSYNIIFAYQSPEQHAAIRCDVKNHLWLCLLVHPLGEEVISTVIDNTLRTNAFSSLLVQIRGPYLSLDVNNKPVLTKLRYPLGGLGGVMGLSLPPQTKVALKQWRLKSIQNNASTKLKRLLPSVEECSNFHQHSLLAVPIAPNLSPSPSPFFSVPASDTKARSRSLLEVLQAKKEGGSHPSPLSPPPTLQAPPLSSSSHLTKQEESELAEEKSESEALYNSISLPNRGARAGARSEVKREGVVSSREVEAGSTRPLSHKIPEEIYAQLTSLNDPGLVDWVLQDVHIGGAGKGERVGFEDIAGGEEAKRLLHEAIVLPLIVPEFFTGLREPWKGVLLFGPPGTGKTMLAKAISSLHHLTFFNCSASSLLSKYRGESEKIVRVLFQAARLLSPSVLFFDEVAPIPPPRGPDPGGAGAAPGEHEASRRLKTELLSQIDGLGAGEERDPQKRIVLLAATNCPWDLDPALLRRLEKRLYLPLPCPATRSALFSLLLQALPIEGEVALEKLVERTGGYSGADLGVVCREAAMRGVRRVLTGKSVEQIAEQRRKRELAVPQISLLDFEEALKCTTPSVAPESVRQYEEWTKLYANT